jgi:hypothetical protein
MNVSFYFLGMNTEYYLWVTLLGYVQLFKEAAQLLSSVAIPLYIVDVEEERHFLSTFQSS